MSETIVITLIVGFVVLVLIVRAVGAWMFRIYEVIDLLKDIRELLGGEKQSQKNSQKKHDFYHALIAPDAHLQVSICIYRTLCGGFTTPL